MPRAPLAIGDGEVLQQGQGYEHSAHHGPGALGVPSGAAGGNDVRV